MKKFVCLFVVCLLLLSTACSNELPTAVTTHPTETTQPTEALNMTTQPTESTQATEPTTAIECTTIGTQVERKDWEWDENGLSDYNSTKYRTFIYDEEEPGSWLRKLLGEKITLLESGYLYTYHEETNQIHRAIDEPLSIPGVYNISETLGYKFCVTADNHRILVSTIKGDRWMVLYEAKEQLSPKLQVKDGYLYFVEGANITKMDVMTGEPEVFFQYEGAVAAIPWLTPPEKPHYFLLRTATDDIACNLETGETAIIPMDGLNGTASFDKFTYSGIWPGSEESN